MGISTLPRAETNRNGSPARPDFCILSLPAAANPTAPEFCSARAARTAHAAGRTAAPHRSATAQKEFGISSARTPSSPLFCGAPACGAPACGARVLDPFRPNIPFRIARVAAATGRRGIESVDAQGRPVVLARPMPGWVLDRDGVYWSIDGPLLRAGTPLCAVHRFIWDELAKRLCLIRSSGLATRLITPVTGTLIDLKAPRARRASAARREAAPPPGIIP